MSNTQTAASDLQVILGGVEIPVERIVQDQPDPVKETIKVRQIPLRLMPKYGSAMGDEATLIELVTNKPAEWVDSLTQESQEQIVEIGDQLNLDPFIRWSTRRLAATKRMEPLTNSASALPKSVLPSALGAESA